MSTVLWLVSPLENAAFFTPPPPPAAGNHGMVTRRAWSNMKLKGVVQASSAGLATRSSEERVYEVVVKQAALVRREERRVKKKEDESKGVDDLKRGESDGLNSNWDLLNQAYDRCGQVCAEYAKTFYLGTLLMTPERRKAVWAIYGMVSRGI